MIRPIRSRKSLSSQLAVLLIIAFLASLLVFFVSSEIGDRIIRLYVVQTDYIKNNNNDNLKDLQIFIYENNLSSSDLDLLYDWQKSHELVFFDIYRDGSWLYTSYFPEERGMVVYSDMNDDTFYTVNFSDCKCEVYFYDTYSYSLSIFSTIACLIISFIVFVLFFMAGVRNNIKYVLTLRDEIKQLEGGNLDYPITVEGNNEFTELALSLDDMRQSFALQLKKEDELKSMNKALTAEISHDIRTPLTVLLLITEALMHKKYSSEEELNQYLKRIHEKACQIQALADSVFNHSVDRTIELTASNSSIQWAPLKTVFDECLFEMTDYLDRKGYTVDSKPEWKDESIEYKPDYIKRITDNILSNIAKYASVDVPVTIRTNYTDNAIIVTFLNGIAKTTQTNESTKIGIKNIAHMMEEMGGSCYIENDGEFFELDLIFTTIDKPKA